MHYNQVVCKLSVYQYFQGQYTHSIILSYLINFNNVQHAGIVHYHMQFSQIASRQYNLFCTI